MAMSVVLRPSAFFLCVSFHIIFYPAAMARVSLAISLFLFLPSPSQPGLAFISSSVSPTARARLFLFVWFCNQQRHTTKQIVQWAIDNKCNA
jgi:hypothetical protein